MSKNEEWKGTADWCDAFEDALRYPESIFTNYGQRHRFQGTVETVQCFEDNSLVKSKLGEPGMGKVLVVDGGGSRNRALLGDQIAEKATKNGWEGG